METQKIVVVSLEGSQKYTRILSGAPQTQGMRSGLVQLSPGQEVGAHNTEYKEEALILLSGKAEISYAENKTLAVNAPAVVYIPAHTVHNVINRGKAPLRYVYVVAPVVP